MTEANDYSGGVDGASNAFASALPAFDNLHWHTAQGAAEVDFFGKAGFLRTRSFASPMEASTSTRRHIHSRHSMSAAGATCFLCRSQIPATSLCG